MAPVDDQGDPELRLRHGSPPNGPTDMNVETGGESGPRLMAVVAEDEAGPRQLLKRLLERRHANVIEVVAEAETGPAALALCEERRPDVLFLDLHLPGLDGFELLSQLRAETYVVITTGDSQHAVEAYRANAIDYLLKPIDPEQLQEAVARVAAAIAGESRRHLRESRKRLMDAR